MSFNCSLSQGAVLGCQTIGGVETVYLGNWEAISAFTQDACGIITGLTPSVALTAYTFETDIEMVGLTQEGSFSRENGTVFFDTNLTIRLVDLDCNKRNNLVEIARAPMFAVIKANSGTYFYAGIETAGRASAGTASLGQALGDFNGVELTINWKSANGVYVLNPALVGTTITII